VLDEDVAHVVDVAAAERRSILQRPIQHPSLPREQLEHLADCHARGKAVRVHDYIGGYAGVCEGHVFLVHNDADNAFLAVPRGELVAQFRTPRLSGLHFDEHCFALGLRDHDFVDVGVVWRSVGHRRGLVLVRSVV